MMSNMLVNPRDQRFLLFEQLRVEELLKHERYEDFTRDIIEMSLKEAEKFAVNDLLPTYELGDRQGVRFEDGKVYAPPCFHAPYKAFCENEWLKAGEPAEVGGQGMPVTVWAACVEYFLAANFSFLIYPGLTWGAASLVHNYGTEKQKAKYMDKMYNGEWGGTMCLTEPNAGSDVGNVKTKAKRLPDGTYSITGTKIFISSGDHDMVDNIIHPVLARIEGDPPGTEGISIFLVPKIRVNDDGSLGEPNDVTVGNVEHKMGIKGSATCTLNFGDNGKCIGEIMGEERKGMKIMFSMMNQARLEVGMQALGYASAAYEHALQYSRERLQSKPIWEMQNPAAKSVAIINHPDVRRMLLTMKSTVEGIRAMNYFTANCIDKTRITADDKDRERFDGYVELLTPILKAYCSDKAVEMTSLGIDVYGGYGYIADYPMEQYYRDAKIACLYEGTNGIQSLDFVGRKMGQKKGANVMNLLIEIAGTIDRAKKFPDLKPYVKHLEDAHMAVMVMAQEFAQWAKGGNFLVPVIYARPVLMIFGDLICGWQLMEGAAVASKRLEEIYREAGGAETKARKRAVAREKADAAFYQGKTASAKFFAVNVLSQIKARCKSIELADMTPIEMLEDSFGG
jgi:alkylation response protein AidB-like acyl-CoA dehydrogenase